MPFIFLVLNEDVILITDKMHFTLYPVSNKSSTECEEDNDVAENH